MSRADRKPTRTRPLGVGLLLLAGVVVTVGHPVERFAAWSLARDGLFLDEAVATAVLLPLALFLVRSAPLRPAAVPEPDVAELIWSRDRFADFARSSGDWLWEMDADLKLSLVDEDPPPSARRLAELFDQGVLSQPDQVRVDADAWQRQWADITRRKPFRGLRFNLLDANGDSQWLELNGTPVFGADGMFQGYRGCGANVTGEATAEARAEHLVLHDTLTDLPNRLLLLARIGHAAGLARSRGERAAVLVLDLDDFKVVNDTLGHAAGDRLLTICAERLREVVAGSGLVARLGGDEFAVVHLDVAQPEAAAVVAQAMAEVLATPVDLGGGEVSVTASIGIALLPDDSQDAEDVLKKADIALHQAKAAGDGVYRFFEAGMDEQLRVRRQAVAELHEAVLDGQFELHYQPIIEAASKQVVGLEALLRWRHPVRGLVPPGDFIALAEETGLMVPLGEWVLRTACMQVQAWPHVRVSINLSPVEFRQPDLVGKIAATLAASELDPARLELEITEAAVLSDPKSAFAVLEDLKALGVRVAIDDFGTAYSSLTYLQRFAFDKIKIDRAFVERLEHGAKEQAMVQAIISLSDNLGMETCAEGVETADQTALLRRQGCVELQGYYFSRPLDAGEIPSLLEASRAQPEEPATTSAA